jgi:hypothetical protein
MHKVYIGSDHAGYELKEKLRVYLSSLGYEVEDKGAFSLNPNDDYPDFIKPVAISVVNDKNSFGVILGGSEEGEIKPIAIFLDSPLASRVTPVFRTYANLFNAEAAARIASGDDLFAFNGLTITKNKQDSVAIHKAENPKIIIAGAGMSAGGRIRSHEVEYLGNKKPACCS